MRSMGSPSSGELDHADGVVQLRGADHKLGVLFREAP